MKIENETHDDSTEQNERERKKKIEAQTNFQKSTMRKYQILKIPVMKLRDVVLKLRTFHSMAGMKSYQNEFYIEMY